VRHERGQAWVKSYPDGSWESRACLDPDEGRYVSLTAEGPWVWTIEERVKQGLEDPEDVWHGWERIR